MNSYGRSFRCFCCGKVLGSYFDRREAPLLSQDQSRIGTVTVCGDCAGRQETFSMEDKHQGG